MKTSSIYTVQAIMGYYGVPSLSLRLAIHHELQLQPDLLHQVWWPEEVWKDQLHPTCIGHRYGDTLGAVQRVACIPI